MALFRRTPEEIAAREEARERRDTEKAAERFAASPPGRARAAKAEGARIFQISIELASTSLIGMAMLGQKSDNHTSTLNEIEAEGWRFEAISTTFIPQTTTIAENSFPAGSREGTTSGTVLATYVFRLA